MLIKTCACIAALLASMAAMASEKPASKVKASTDAQDLELIYRLAERPVAVVVGNICKVRGAVWGNGPRPGVKQALVNVLTGETFRTKTGASGVYSLDIPYHGQPIVLQEQIDEPVHVIKEFSATAHVINGGVVCDHRLRTAVAQAPNSKENK